MTKLISKMDTEIRCGETANCKEMYLAAQGGYTMANHHIVQIFKLVHQSGSLYAATNLNCVQIKNQLHF